MERSSTDRETTSEPEARASVLSEERKNILRANYENILEGIARAAERSGRSAEDIELVAVTKTVPVDIINYAISLGARHIGENRVQELASKYDLLDKPEGLSVSVIGHLQSNKAKRAVEMAGMIQSVDSVHIAEEISKRACECGKVMPCLIEINIGGEQSKSGVPIERAEELICAAAELPSIRVCGLMTIPPADADDKQLRKYFEEIYKFYVDNRRKKSNNNIEMKFLSMGMSSDYRTAIECGSNMVRIGTYIFGARVYK